MKRNFKSWILIAIIALITINGALAVLTPSDVTAWYTCENNVTNVQGNTTYDLTKGSAVTYTTALKGTACVFSSNSNSYLTAPNELVKASLQQNASSGLSNNYTVCWVQDISSTNTYTTLYSTPIQTGGFGRMHILARDVSGTDYWELYEWSVADNGWSSNANPKIFTNTSAMTVCIARAANGTEYVYQNGVQKSVTNSAGTKAVPFEFNGAVLTIGKDIQNPSDTSRNFLGNLDEIAFFNRVITQTEAAQYHNSGNYITYSDLALPSIVNTITLSLSNLINDTAWPNTVIISNVTGVNLNFTFFNITNAGFCVQQTGNGTKTNCTSTGSGTSTYFNVTNTTTITGDQSVTAKTYQAIINITAKQLLTNATINSFNSTNNLITNTTTGGFLLLPANNGSNTITTNVLGNYTKISTCTITAPLQTIGCNASDIYDTLLNITLRNAWTNNTVNAYNGWTYHQITGTNTTYTTTNGSTLIPALRQAYDTYIEASGYSVGSDNLASFTATSTPYNYNFRLYSNNSIRMFIYDSITGQPVLFNVTIQTIGTNSTITNYTTSGSFLQENLRDGVYTIKFSNANYSTATYTVTVADRSTQELNAYLSGNASEVIISVSDIESGLSLENASIAMYGTVNGTPTLLSSRLTDITGRTIFQYTPSTRYAFSVTKDGYQALTYVLDPILFSSYDIKLRRSTTTNYTGELSGVSVTFTPKTFYANQTNRVTYVIYSANGALNTYNLTITYPGGTYANSGTKSTGDVFNTSLSITNAGINDRVNVSYCYTTVLSPNVYCFTYQYFITGAYIKGTLAALKDNTYGLGLLERILIVVVLSIITAGIIGMITGMIGGAVAAMLLMGFFVATGFIPLWSVIITFVVGFFLIIKGGFV